MYRAAVDDFGDGRSINGQRVLHAESIYSGHINVKNTAESVAKVGLSESIIAGAVEKKHKSAVVVSAKVPSERVSATQPPETRRLKPELSEIKRQKLQPQSSKNPSALLAAAKTAALSFPSSSRADNQLYPSLSIFPTSGKASAKNRNDMTELSFPTVIVLRHVPGAVTVSAINDFFEDLKVYLSREKRYYDVNGVWAVPSSLPESGTCCHCPACSAGHGYDERQLIFDVYVHFFSASSALVALMRSGESLKVRAGNESISSSSDDIRLLESRIYSRGGLISVPVLVEEVCLEEQCWMYLTGFPVGEGKSISSLYAVLQALLPHSEYLNKSIAVMSSYWTKFGFRITNFRKLIHRVSPVCRRFVIDEESRLNEDRNAVASEALNKASGRKRSRLMKKITVENDTYYKEKKRSVGPRESYSDWILQSYSHAERCTDPIMHATHSCSNRLLNEHDLIAVELNVAVAPVQDHRCERYPASAMPSRYLVSDSDIEGLRAAQRMLTDEILSLKFSSVTGGGSGGNESFCMAYLDRALYLFNILEVWALKLRLV